MIIPDIQNNDMILRETVGLRIPIIGLVNSDCATEIAYPIFGNADSIKIVNFFCHFLAVLIAKEIYKQDHKNKSHRIFAKTR
jgi:ribosomal protein S2